MRLALVTSGNKSGVLNAETGEELEDVLRVTFDHDTGENPVLEVRVRVLSKAQAQARSDQRESHLKEAERRAEWATNLAYRLGLTFDGISRLDVIDLVLKTEVPTRVA